RSGPPPRSSSPGRCWHGGRRRSRNTARWPIAGAGPRRRPRRLRWACRSSRPTTRPTPNRQWSAFPARLRFRADRSSRGPASNGEGSVASPLPFPPVDLDVLRAHVRDIPDYPKPGVLFKDITPLLAAPEVFAATVDALAAPYTGEHIDKVLGIEARGFVFAAPVAYQHQAGFVPVRKAGKLPWEIEREEYELEYGTDLLEIHRDAVQPGERVLIVDDVLATGGTASAALALA